MKNENIISVGEILKECKRKFVLIIACVVVFAILLAGAKFYLDSAAVDVLVEDDGTTAAPPLDVYEESEIAKIEKYIDFVEKHNSMKKYMEESIYMNLDFANVYFSSIQFQVIEDSSLECTDILYYLNNYVKYGGLVDDICASNADMRSMYLQEVIEFRSLLENSKEATSNIFNVNVYGRSIEEVDSIAALVENQLKKNAKENESMDFDLVIVERNAGVSSKLTVCEDQTRYQSRLTELATKMQTMKDQLSERQILTANAILAVEEDEEEIEVAEGAKVEISKTFILLGGVLGGIFGVCLIYVLYYFDNTLKSDEEIENRYKLQCIGSTRDSLDIVSAKVYALSNGQKLNNIALVATKDVDEHVMKSCYEGVLKYGVKVSLLGDVLTNVESIIGLSKCENVILLCKIRETSYMEMNNMLQNLHIQNKNVLGYIAVK